MASWLVQSVTSAEIISNKEKRYLNYAEKIANKYREHLKQRFKVSEE